MEAYGVEITDPRLQFFPLAVLIPSASADTWHAATFFYESVWNAIGFLALWKLRRRQRDRGNVFAWYLLIYGAGRFVIEQLRTDSLYMGSLRISQYVSLVLCAGAALIIAWRACKHQSKPFAAAAVCCGLWLLRWFFVENHLVYTLLFLAAGVLALWFVRSSKKGIPLLLGVVLLDALGLAAAIARQPVSGEAALFLHALACSLTLPAGVYVLCYEE